MDLILVIRRDPQGQEINDVRIVLHVGGLKGLVMAVLILEMSKEAIFPSRLTT